MGFNALPPPPPAEHYRLPQAPKPQRDPLWPKGNRIEKGHLKEGHGEKATSVPVFQADLKPKKTVYALPPAPGIPKLSRIDPPRHEEGTARISAQARSVIGDNMGGRTRKKGEVTQEPDQETPGPALPSFLELKQMVFEQAFKKAGPELEANAGKQLSHPGELAKLIRRALRKTVQTIRREIPSPPLSEASGTIIHSTNQKPRLHGNHFGAAIRDSLQTSQKLHRKEQGIVFTRIRKGARQAKEERENPSIGTLEEASAFSERQSILRRAARAEAIIKKCGPTVSIPTDPEEAIQLAELIDRYPESYQTGAYEELVAAQEQADLDRYPEATSKMYFFEKQEQVRNEIFEQALASYPEFLVEPVEMRDFPPSPTTERPQRSKNQINIS